MIQDAIRQGRDGDMADLARLAVAALGGQGETSGVIGSTCSASAGRWTCASSPRSASRARRSSTATTCAASRRICGVSSNGR